MLGVVQGRLHGAALPAAKESLLETNACHQLPMAREQRTRLRTWEGNSRGAGKAADRCRWSGPPSVVHLAEPPPSPRQARDHLHPLGASERWIAPGLLWKSVGSRHDGRRRSRCNCQLPTLLASPIRVRECRSSVPSWRDVNADNSVRHDATRAVRLGAASCQMKKD